MGYKVVIMPVILLVAVDAVKVELVVVIHLIDILKPQTALVNMPVCPFGHPGTVLRLCDELGIITANMAVHIDVCARVDPGPVLLVALIQFEGVQRADDEGVLRAWAAFPAEHERLYIAALFL